MPKLWIRALDNYTKHNEFKSRSDTIRRLLYPALAKMLKLLDLEAIIEPIVERKKVIKRTAVARRFKKAMKRLSEIKEKAPKRFTSFSNFIAFKKPEEKNHVEPVKSGVGISRHSSTEPEQKVDRGWKYRKKKDMERVSS
jgi:Arc/MetJ-type ribon-helix-helix transcriptional regulator